MKRREFLAGTAATAAWSAFPRALAQSAPSLPGKVDLHVHLGRNRDEMSKIAKDNLAAAVKYLIGEMDRHNVEKAQIVAVEPLFPTDLYLEAAKL